jgi:hypothetical protein
MQVRSDFTRVREPELPVELQSVSATGNARMFDLHESEESLDRIYRMDRITKEQILKIQLILSNFCDVLVA